MTFFRPIAFGTLLLLSAVCSAADKPNVILILADDQGWNGLSCQMDPNVPESKSDYYQTPNIDRLANGGMRFSRGYAPAPVCSPTRHSIQFGISPAKTRVTYNSYGTKQHCNPELAMANLIKKADPSYATAHFGKWHVSVKPDLCGYDESDGSTSNREGSNSKDKDDPKRVYGVTKRSVAFMEKAVAAKKPFFLQVSHYADHLKFKSSQVMQAKYEALTPGERHTDPVFAGMNEDLDAGVGQIMDAVEKLGIKDNTYIVYTADNGFDQSNDRLHGIAERKAWPLAYSKGFVFEGGVRVPFIVRGPGIKPNSFSSVPVVGYDLMPTFLELIKPSFPVPKITEGGSMVPVLKNGGEGKIERPNDFIVFHYPNGVWPSQTSLVKGNHKIVKTWAFDCVEMFDLRTDMSEQKDLSKQMPEKAQELHGVMTRYLERVNAVAPTDGELANDRAGLLMKKGGAKKKGEK